MRNSEQHFKIKENAIGLFLRSDCHGYLKITKRESERGDESDSEREISVVINLHVIVITNWLQTRVSMWSFSKAKFCFFSELFAKKGFRLLNFVFIEVVFPCLIIWTFCSCLCPILVFSIYLATLLETELLCLRGRECECGLTMWSDRSWQTYQETDNWTTSLLCSINNDY